MTPEQFEKEAKKQRVYKVLFLALLLQVALVLILFGLGAIEESRWFIRILLLIELVVFGGIYGYIKIRGSKEPRE